MKLIPTCRETAGLLSQALDRQLTWREKLLVQIHLPLCRGCRNFRVQLAFMRRAGARWAERSP